VKVDAATLAGGSSNQDAYAVLEHALVVLDGASTYPPSTPGRDGGWYARTLLDVLCDRLPGFDSALACILTGAIAQIRDDHQLHPGGPSSTVLVTRINDETLDFLVLGDSTLVIQHPDDTCTALTDDRLAHVAVAERQAYLQRLRDGGGYDSQHTHLLADVQAAQRLARNHPDGYWIAECDPEAARHGISRTLPIDQVKALLLLTDGAASGVTTYGVPNTWPELVRQVVLARPGQVLDDLHQLEETDPAGQRWPRAKPHDDKTAILLRALGTEPSSAIN
jgi:serine/threonine protein phosphatase PrpC